MKKMMIGIAILAAVWGMLAQGATWRPLTVEEAAVVGATHVARFDYKDFAGWTNTNTAKIFTNTTWIVAKDAVTCVGMVLEQAYDTGNTNYTGSVAMKVGDSGDDDLYLTSTELASDGSEVWVKFGRKDVETLTSTVTKQTASVAVPGTAYTASATLTVTTNAPAFIKDDGTTNTAYFVTGVSLGAITVTANATNTYAVMTNATVATTAAAGVSGQKVYTSGDYLIVTFTPNSEEALSANTAGAVRLYFSIRQGGK